MYVEGQLYLSWPRIVQFDEFEGGEQLPGRDFAQRDVVELQLRFFVDVLHSFDLRLCVGATQKPWTALKTTPSTQF